MAKRRKKESKKHSSPGQNCGPKPITIIVEPGQEIRIVGGSATGGGPGGSSSPGKGVGSSSGP